MALTVKIDTRSKAAKLLVEYLKTLSFVKIEEVYDPEFVEKIKKAEQEEGEVMTNAKDLWESIK